MTLNLDDAARTANKAVDLAVLLFTSLTADEITTKTDRDIVTNVDLTIEREVRAFLHSQGPDATFLGEEEGGAELEDGRFWVLDPIDGTANYTHGIPLNGISLALVEDGTPVVGVIATPNLSGKRYTATTGAGSWSGGKKLSVSTTTDPGRAIVSVGDFATGPGAAEKNADRLHLIDRLSRHVERVRMFGSAAVDLAWVSEGITDGMIMLVNKPWDTTAGALIAAEAGALVTDYQGAPYTLGSTSILAASPQLAPALIELIQGERRYRVSEG